MTATIALYVLLGLFTKHFIVDFPMQGPFQYKNKGTWGHPGGILHAWLHCLGTWICFAFVTKYAIVYAVFDFIAHYHIDWAKMNINAKMGWGPTTHEQFWWLLGADQFLHALTYIGMVMVLV